MNEKFEYKFTLPFKVESCLNCPFRKEQIHFENVESVDKLSGTCVIHRKDSYCILREKQIFNNERVDGYNSECPLKNNITIVRDK
ncbi:hypothetical protein [Clostridium sp. C2-6-12]|uniref:hypothetical protein n=1 Tax=Clostridium sp. C2-6-12 TaxID=2698832 RepID=UPI0013720994|nr:hypothetical protein [Clostridium sp. C2-6-12]